MSSSGARRLPELALVGGGVLIGAVGALCGIGGGLFAASLLHVVLRLPLKQAVATGLCLVLATTSAATVTELLRSDTQFILTLVAAVAGGALVGSQLGFLVAQRIQTRRLKQVFVVVLALAGARLLLSRTAGEALPVLESVSTFELVIGFAAGLGGGFLAPLLGVGGGLLMVPALFVGIDALGFAGARATSLAAGSVGALRSLWLHARAGRVHWRPGLLLARGALAGSSLAIPFTRQSAGVQTGRVLLTVILWLVALRFLRELHATRGLAEPQA